VFLFYYRPIRIDVRSVRGKHQGRERIGRHQPVIAKSRYQVREIGRDTRLLSGLALIDMKALEAIHEVPITVFLPRGHVITRNPVFLETANRELRLYAVPDDERGRRWSMRHAI
jgi:Family of unknown function (DUF6454)